MPGTYDEQLAKTIAKYLFTNGMGQHASRLVLELPGGKNGGGWSESAVRDAIKNIFDKQSMQQLKAEMKTKK